MRAIPCSGPSLALIAAKDIYSQTGSVRPSNRSHYATPLSLSPPSALGHDDCKGAGTMARDGCGSDYPAASHLVSGGAELGQVHCRRGPAERHARSAISNAVEPICAGCEAFRGTAAIRDGGF